MNSSKECNSIINFFFRLLIIGICSGVVEAFVPSFGSKIRTKVGLSATCRRDVFLLVAVYPIGFTFRASPALAERSLGTVTESYKRYVPRMEAGFAFLAKDLKGMIDTGDIDGVVAEINAEKGTTLSAMKGTMKVIIMTDAEKWVVHCHFL